MRPGHRSAPRSRRPLARWADRLPTSRPSSAGGEVRTGDTHDVVSPHCHQRVLAKVHQADAATIDAAIKAAVEAQRDWGHWRFEDRAAVFLKAADLLATVHRQLLNAATMLGQSKTAFQAEIDSACELIDFLRFNVHFAERIYREQPESSTGIWNRMDHRPLEGFVYAITPFNFTAIGGNLPTAPALMGNTVIWKPSATATLSNWHFYRLLQEAGLPPGVINFLPGDSIAVSRALLSRPPPGWDPLHRLDGRVPDRSGARWRRTCRSMPATRGSSARPAARTSSWPTPAPTSTRSRSRMVRGAYEYQGQKCSAASRAYIPDTLWPAVRERVTAHDRRHPDGRRRRLPQLHGRGDRQAGLRPSARAPGAGEEGPRCEDPRRRRHRRQRRLVRRSPR